MLLVLLTSLLLTSVVESSQDPGPLTCENVGTTLHRYTRATRALINYLFKYRDYMELDGLSGVQFANGAVIQAMKQPFAKHINAKRMLTSLSQKLMLLSQTLLPIVEKDNPEYFRRFRPVVEKPLILSEPFTNLDNCHKHNFEKYRKHKQKHLYNESAGDKCFVDLFGTSSKQGHRCKITEKCWNQIVGKALGGKAYVVTHALLYLFFFQMQKCSYPKADEIQQMIHLLMCRLRIQTELNLKRISPSASLIDLTLEEELALYLGGYRKGGKLDSMAFFNLMLSTQTREGCFSDFVQTNGPRRRLLYSKTMPGFCESHENGLALNFLVVEIIKLLKFKNTKCVL